MTHLSATSSHSSRPASASPLRILCLHGYLGSAAVVRQQLAPLASEWAGLAELVCVDAPSRARGDNGWWHAVDGAARRTPGHMTGQDKEYRGWAETRAYLVDVFARQGPFDGVFGMSQGAALTGLLVGLRAPDGRPTPARPLVFDFAILTGGFQANDARLAPLYVDPAPFALPTAHIIGRTDSIVAPQQSYRLARLFKDREIWEHPGGHVVPNTAEVRRHARRFVEARWREKQERAGRGQCVAPEMEKIRFWQRVTS